MTPLAARLTTGQVALILVGIFIVLSVIAGFLSRWFLRRGLREPIIVRMINRASTRVVEVIKRPITLAVLEQVSQVLKSTHYTRAVASALNDNRENLKAMIAEKIKDDPSTGRIGLLPFHDRIIAEVTETTFRVVMEVLADPRTDELVSDLLRDNLNQIRAEIRQLPEGV